jgi:hypothetical protein
MSEIVELYGDYTKDEIIAGLQRYLRDNKIKRKRSDGFGKDKGNGLERPTIEGCKLPYLQELKNSGWFTRKKDKWEERKKLGWRTFHVNGKFIQKPPDFLLVNEKPRN